jgi:exosome complex exonuclease RRP6
MLNNALVHVTEALDAFLKQADVTVFQEWKEYGVLYDEIKVRHRLASERLLELISSLIGYLDGSKSEFQNAEDLLENYHNVIDVNDGILERADTYWDQSSRSSTTKTPSIVSKNIKGKNADYRLIYSPHLMRPQLKFEDKIDNFAPVFIPKLKEKPHAQISLEDSLKWSIIDTLDIELEIYQSRRGYPNPYAYEMMHLNYPHWLFENHEREEYPKTLDQVPCHWIDTVDQLNQLVKILEKQRDIAVDLEHHNYRSYYGFVCLMQISTREEDYLIDTLALRSHLHILNRCFTHPNIVKVFHGANSDIGWLQRDFGIYVVNLFDTAQAARVLQMSNCSLAHLLKLYVDIETDKKYQLADWRIRPLTNEMYCYSRIDTHYLLYIFDRLRRELLEKADLMDMVLLQSRNVALRTCDKVIGNGEETAMALVRKYKRVFTSSQTAVVKALLDWRDRLAREEDESVGFVLPNAMLLRLADILPTDATQVVQCCSPIPPLVRVYASDLALLISKTKYTDMKKNQEEFQDLDQKEKTIFQDASLSFCEHIAVQNEQQKRIILPEMTGEKDILINSEIREKTQEKQMSHVNHHHVIVQQTSPSLFFEMFNVSKLI